MKRILIPLVALLCLQSAISRGQKVTDGYFGKRGYDVAYSAAATSDGGYIFTGLTMSGADTLGDIVTIKTNEKGAVIWSQVYGGPKLEGGNNVIETADGGFLVSGHTEDFGAQDCDAFMMKLDQKGNREWLQVYGGEKDDIAEGACEMPDGGFIMIGITASFGNPDSSERRHLYLVRTDSRGNKLWSKYYAGSVAEYGYSIVQVSGGGFLAAGWTMSRGNGEHDAWLLRLNETGDTLWTRTCKQAGDSKFFKIVSAGDGGFYLAGQTAGAIGSRPSGLIVKLDASGSELWKKAYGEANEGYIFHDITELPGGHLLVAGTTLASDSTGNIYVMETDAGGEKLKDDVYGGFSSFAGAIASQGNNGHLIAGKNTQRDDKGDLYYVLVDNTDLHVPSLEQPAPHMYPNPVKEKAVIVLPSVHANQLVTLEVRDAGGRLISRKERVQAKDLVISHNGLDSGTYMYRISCADGKVYTGKFQFE